MARNFIDRCFEAVAPVHAVRRSAARTALQFLNSGYGNYGANLTKKSMRGWEYHGGSSKEDIEDNIDVLRQRSRDAYMGVPVAWYEYPYEWVYEQWYQVERAFQPPVPVTRLVTRTTLSPKGRYVLAWERTPTRSTLIRAFEWVLSITEEGYADFSIN